MKKILLSLSIISVFAACKSSQQKNETETPLLLAPTANYQNSALTDTAQAVIKEAANAPKPRAIEKTTIIYRNTPIQSPASPKPVFDPEPAVSTTPATTEAKEPDASGTTAAEAGNTEASNKDAEEAQQEKKGISKAAKGAIIGGVGGAVAGAVIGKNGKGAIIGGVIGAAGGYVLGRKQDKKDGRVN